MVQIQSKLLLSKGLSKTEKKQSFQRFQFTYDVYVTLNEKGSER